MDPNIKDFIELFLTVITSVLASSGFWAWYTKRLDQKDVRNKLLLGLAHDRIVYLSMGYLSRGSISKDEYETLCQYLYEPYLAMGGNGMVKRMMSEVDKLPITENSFVLKGEKIGC